MQPQRRQPTRLLCPWDSPGKNTGVGCHFLLQCMKVKSESEVTQSCPTLPDSMDCSLPGSFVHGIFQAIVLEWTAISFSKYLKSYFFDINFFEISLNDASIRYTIRPTSWSSMTPYFHAWPLKTRVRCPYSCLWLAPRHSIYKPTLNWFPNFQCLRFFLVQPGSQSSCLSWSSLLLC